MNEPELIKLSEAQRRFSISRNTLMDAIYARKLPAVRFCGKGPWHVSPENVRKLMLTLDQPQGDGWTREHADAAWNAVLERNNIPLNRQRRQREVLH